MSIVKLQDNYHFCFLLLHLGRCLARLPVIYSSYFSRHVQISDVLTDIAGNRRVIKSMIE